MTNLVEMKRALRDTLTQKHDYPWRVPCLPTGRHLTI